MGLKQFLAEEDAATTTEYAILLSLLIMAIFSTVAGLGAKFNSDFNNTSTKL